jgi:hypothetical protein
MSKYLTIKSVLLLAQLLLGACNINLNSSSSDHELHAKEFISRLRNEMELPIVNTPTITRRAVIKIAEPVLFKTYGERNIKMQKPYKTYLIDGYWHICGTIKKMDFGGVFEIVLNGENGQVIKVTHGK